MRTSVEGNFNRDSVRHPGNATEATGRKPWREIPFNIRKSLIASVFNPTANQEDRDVMDWYNSNDGDAKEDFDFELASRQQ